MKKCFALLLIVLLLGLTACGAADRGPAIDTYNAANATLTDVAELVNANIWLIDPGMVEEINQKILLMTEHKAALEGEKELTEEALAAITEELRAIHGSLLAVEETLRAELG